MGGRGEEAKDIPVGPDDLTPTHALQRLVVDDLASGTSSATGCLAVSGGYQEGGR